MSRARDRRRPSRLRPSPARLASRLLAILLVVGVAVWIPSGSATAAPAASGDTPFTVVDLGNLAFPTDANSSDVVVGYILPVNVAEPTVWVSGHATQLQVPAAPAGTSFCGAEDELINSAGVIAATADFCPSGFSSASNSYAPTVWYPTNGVYGAPQAIDPSPASAVETLSDIDDAGHALISVNPFGVGAASARIGHLNATTATTIPGARAAGVVLDGTRFTFSSSSDASVRVATFAHPDVSTPFGLQLLARSGTGWVLGCALSTHQCGTTLTTQDPAGTQQSLPPYPDVTSGQAEKPGIDQNGDVVAGDRAPYYLAAGSTTWREVASLFPAGSGFTMANYQVQISRMSRNGDVLGTDNEPGGGGPPEFRGFALLRPHANPPVVNSTADGAAVRAGSDGCTTGKTVTVNGQSVPQCTLRAAIQAENAGSVDQKSITFDTALTASSPAVISPATALPAITAAGITIDFASGTTGSSTVELDRSGAADTSIGLDVKASGVTVKGLQVHGFGTGLLLEGPGHDTVVGSVLGQGAGGDTGNTMGVEITSPSDVIGGSTAVERNVIAGNTTFGVYIHGSAASGTVVTGDYVGVYADGQTEAANKVGVWIRDASGTTVGGSTGTPGTGAGDLFNGGGTSDGAIDVVGISAKVSGTVIAGDSFGLAADGTAFASTCGHEISVLGSTRDTRIGGGSGQGNVIDGLCQREIQVSSIQSTGAQILGNRIGTDRTGSRELAGFTVDNTAVAIGVSGATHTTIGQPGQGNIVLGGFSSAIQTQTLSAAATIEYPTSTPVPGTGTTLKGASSTIISGNSLGVLADVPSTQVLGTGVLVTGSGDSISHNQIALTPAAIDIEKATGTETVSANLLGVTAAGTGALPLADGVLVNASAKTTVTGNTTHTAGPAIALLGSANSQVSGNKIDVTASGNGPLTAYTGTVPAGWANAVASLQHVGVTIDAKSNTALVRGNVIGTVAGPGLVIDAAGSLVDDNHIGLGLDGHSPIGNTGDGIDVAADDVTVGAAGTGTSLTGTGNIIADNGGAGVNVAINHRRVTIRSNSIHDNTNGAIVLSGNANAAIPAPRAPGAVQDGHGHTIVFLAGLTGSTAQVYAAANCPPDTAEPGTPAQGQTLLASATIDATGNRAVAMPVQPVGASIDATVTDSALGTSQFSGCVTVAPAARGTVTDPDPNDGDTDTVHGSGFSPGEPVQGQLHSAPVNLGTHTADADGNVTFTFTAAKNLPAGTHYVLLQGQTSGSAVALPITVRTVPGPPRALTARAGKRSVALSWAAPAATGGTAVTGYRVLRSTNDKTFTHVATTASRHWTATRLTGGRRYWFEVEAVNAVGTSQPSAKAAATPYAPPSAPRHLTATSGRHRVALHWTGPAHTNGSATTHYLVEYVACPATHKSCTWPGKPRGVHTRTTRTSSITLGSLAHRRYEFRVLAVNRAGAGPGTPRVVAEPHA